MAEEAKGIESQADPAGRKEPGGPAVERGATIQEGAAVTLGGSHGPGPEIGQMHPEGRRLMNAYAEMSENEMVPVGDGPFCLRKDLPRLDALRGEPDTEAVPGVILPRDVMQDLVEADAFNNAPRETSRIYWGVQFTGKAWLSPGGGVTIDPSMGYWTQNRDAAEKRAESFGANLCQMELTIAVRG